MEQKLKIPLVSAMALLAFGSIMFGLSIGVVVVLGHSPAKPAAKKVCRCGAGCLCPSCSCQPARLLPKDKYEAPVSGECLPPVNESALNEPKTGIFGGRYVVPQNRYPVVVNQPCVPCQPTVAPQPAKPASPTRIAPGDKPAQEPLRYQISLYLLPGDAKSEQIKKWFETDETLVGWRSQCTYQEFSPDNRLYQTLRTPDGRNLKDVVPVSEFPAIVVTKPDGGHIHAAGKAFIPSTPAELISDIQHANVLSKQVPARSGVLVSSGYSWDSQIAPQLRLSSDCDSGTCPNIKPEENAEGTWVPGQKIHDLFAQRVAEKSGWAKDAFWGWLDIIVAGVVAILVIIVLGFLGLIALVALLYFIRKSGS